MAKRRLNGVVLGNKMQNTVVVEVERRAAHPKYKKIMKIRKKYYVHSEDDIEVGEKVVIEETKPISKLKRWVIVKNTEEKK